MYTTRQLSNLSPRCLMNLAASAPGEYGTPRRIAHNTWVERTGECSVAVRFQRTRILHFDFEAGTVEVNTGGWRTNTTKQRLNALLPAHLRVTQQAFAWYVNDYGAPGQAAGSVRCLFEDGDTFDIYPSRPAFEVVAEYTVAV